MSSTVVLPGFSIPAEDRGFIRGLRNFFDLNLPSNLDVIEFLVKSKLPGNPLSEIVGQPKANNHGLDAVQSFMLKILDLNKQNYLYFGNGNFTEILSRFLKTNPFFASALTLIPGSEDFKFELRTFRNPGQSTADESWYTPIMESSLRDPSTGLYRTATPEWNREVNALFTSDFRLVSITCKDGTIIDSFSESQLNLYCSGLLYNLFFYSSAVHAAMHVLHYLMGAGIDSATAHHDVMDKWASYDRMSSA